MANPFPAVFRDDNSETRLSGKVDFTDPTNQPGGGSPSLSGPFSVSFDTPGFLNPDDAGINTIALPAGTLLLDVIPLATAEWVGAVPHDQLIATVLTSPAGSGSTFAGFSLALVPGGGSPSVALDAHWILDAGINGGSVEALDWGNQKRPILAVADCHICLAGYTAGPITAGSLDLYALTVAT